MRIQESMDLYEKLQILTDAAKYDVACTSSGADRERGRYRDGKLRESWNLPQLFGGWPMHFPFEDSFYQRMYL